jgi:hypothetical protein
MKKLLLTLVFLTGSCVTARVVRDQGDTKTLGVKAGIFGESMYESDLRKKARSECRGEFDVIYEGREPKELNGIYIRYEDYFLVVKCRR